MVNVLLLLLLQLVNQQQRRVREPSTTVTTTRALPSPPTAPNLVTNTPFGGYHGPPSTHQGNRRPISLEFVPTKRPFEQAIASTDQNQLESSEFLRHGSAKLLGKCSGLNRIPCNKAPTITRDTCKRWKCCWNASDPVPCAKSVFYKPAIDPFLVAILNGRIIGGTTAIDGEWPWMAYIYHLALGPVNGGVCGGTLLNNNWVITAAHCIATNNPALFGVILGDHTISEDSGREVQRTVRQIIVHEQFNTLSFNNDVALIELAEPVTYTEFVRPACLVASGTRTDNTNSPTFAGAVCSILGWGFTSSPVGARSDVLMQLNLIITPRIFCESLTIQFEADYGGRVVTQDSPKFCAGGSLGEDSCNGDSGGPLLCLHEDGIYYLHGITSYGTNVCAQAQKPGIYTRLATPELNDWITQRISQ